MSETKETPINGKHFWCVPCSHYWLTGDYSEPEHTGADLPLGSAQDELNYYSRCPICKDWAKAVPHYYANIPKMHTTGPRTVAGKRRSSLNGMKHGMYAQPHHLLAPANGKYDICRECVARQSCKNGELEYCPMKTDLMVRVIAAYENGDHSVMRQYAGMSQAKLMLIMENILADVMRRGPLIRQPKVSGGSVVKISKPGKDGEEESEEILYEYVQHPLIKDMPKVMAALGFTSDQQEMNQHASTDKDGDLEGNLGKTSPINFLSEMKSLVETIQRGGPELAQKMREEDPVYLTEKEDADDEAEVIVEKRENPFLQ